MTEFTLVAGRRHPKQLLVCPSTHCRSRRASTMAVTRDRVGAVRGVTSSVRNIPSIRASYWGKPERFVRPVSIREIGPGESPRSEREGSTVSRTASTLKMRREEARRDRRMWRIIENAGSATMRDELIIMHQETQLRRNH